MRTSSLQQFRASTCKVAEIENAHIANNFNYEISVQVPTLLLSLLWNVQIHLKAYSLWLKNLYSVFCCIFRILICKLCRHFSLCLDPDDQPPGSSSLLCIWSLHDAVLVHGHWSVRPGDWFWRHNLRQWHCVPCRLRPSVLQIRLT